MFVLNWYFASLFVLSVALGFQICLLVACFLDICSLSTYLKWIQELVFFKILICFSKRSWPSHFLPKTRELNWLWHFTLAYIEGQRNGHMYTVLSDSDVITKTKIFCFHGFTKSLIHGAPRMRLRCTQSSTNIKQCDLNDTFSRHIVLICTFTQYYQRC